MNIKTLLSIAALAALAVLTACGSGEFVAPAEGVSCADVDKTNAPAGWCANPTDVVHAGKPNSSKGVVSAQADVATKE